MTTLHIFLKNPNPAFDFAVGDFAPLTRMRSDMDIVFHETQDAFLTALPDAELVTCWQFKQTWFDRAPNLKAVFTPAAGKDWVAEDPTGRVQTVFGTFHGPMIAESLLGMMLYFNRMMPMMLDRQRQHAWQSGMQAEGRMLANQRALIVGYGSIGKVCAALLSRVGMDVAGYQRTIAGGTDPETGAAYVVDDGLPVALAAADHVIVLLPGGEATHGFMDRSKLAAMKPGSILYNFGRGTTTLTEDVLWALDHGPLAGAGLDVTEVEPLPADSPLWDHPKVLLTPHSSCVYQEYGALHVAELIEKLGEFL